MKRKRFTEEQIIGVLREHEAGGTAKEICRRHGISEQTFYRWKSKYGGMGVSDARRLKALESENARLLDLPGMRPVCLCRGFGSNEEVPAISRGWHRSATPRRY